MEQTVTSPRNPPGEAAQRTAVLPVNAASGGSSSVSARESRSMAFFSAAVMLLTLRSATIAFIRPSDTLSHPMGEGNKS